MITVEDNEWEKTFISFLLSIQKNKGGRKIIHRVTEIEWQ